MYVVVLINNVSGVKVIGPFDDRRNAMGYAHNARTPTTAAFAVKVDGPS